MDNFIAITLKDRYISLEFNASIYITLVILCSFFIRFIFKTPLVFEHLFNFVIIIIIIIIIIINLFIYSFVPTFLVFFTILYSIFFNFIYILALKVNLHKKLPLKPQSHFSFFIQYKSLRSISQSLVRVFCRLLWQFEMTSQRLSLKDFPFHLHNTMFLK